MSAPADEPLSDSTDDIVDAYYDTGAYLTDPTRPGATIEPLFDSRVIAVAGFVIGWLAGLGLCALLGLV